MLHHIFAIVIQNILQIAHTGEYNPIGMRTGIQSALTWYI